MEKSKRDALVKRLLSSLALAPLVLAAVWYSWTTNSILLVVISALLAWEWAEMVPNKKNSVYALTYLSSACCFIFFPNVIYSLAVMLLATLFIWFKAKCETHRRLLTVGVPYIVLGVGAMVWLYVIFGWVATIWLILTVWAVDIGGYVIGSTVKGPKLAPAISPNKTWSGLIGAMLFAALASVAIAYVFGRPNLLIFAILGAGLAVIAQIGDLLESKIKRYLKIKDSSNLIPGHGGIFDRIDGLLFSAPFVLVVFVLFII